MFQFLGNLLVRVRRRLRKESTEDCVGEKSGGVRERDPEGALSLA